MFPTLFAAAPAAPPPAAISSGEWLPWLLAAVSLLLSGFFAVLRSALSRSIRARVLGLARTDERRAALAPLLSRADSLETSAAVLKVGCDLVFALLVLVLVLDGGELDWGHLLGSLLISVPSLLLFGELLPVPFVDSRGDAFLARMLPSFHLLQLPLEEFVRLLERSRRIVLRSFGLRPPSTTARELVEGLRDRIEVAVGDGDLAETERELIENVMDFRDVDVAEIMTPRTEIQAISRDATFEEALAVVKVSPHSRLPVHDSSLDQIVGSVAVKDILVLMNGGGEESDRAGTIRSIVRPAYFVPETKMVSELLGELRRERTKMAIVLDEYGGTAGLVTIGDVLAELVGEFPDEHDDAEPESIRFVEGGPAEVDASLRVSEVNESLGIGIPEEEDYETLAGFVLAELGHFPNTGEQFEHDGATYSVIEASDRRVLRVAIQNRTPETSTV